MTFKQRMFFPTRRAGRNPELQDSSHPFLRTLKRKLTIPFLASKPSPDYAPPSSLTTLASTTSHRGSDNISHPRHLRRQRGHQESTFRGRSRVQQYTHPVHRLPVELLSHIFILGSQDSVSLPIAVSHVCRHWRRTALRTPALWRRITLSPKERMWKERIKRAKACSLDVQLLPSPAKSLSRASRRYDGPSVDLDPYSIQWHMHMVIPHIARWRSFEVAFPSYAPYLWKAALSRICSHRGTQAPLLEDLRLCYKQNDDHEAFTIFSGSAPKLRRATLVGIRLKWLPSLFANLTVLDYTHHGFTVGYQAIQDVVDILSVSSALVNLSLSFPRKPNPCLPCRTEPVQTRVLLTQLKSLTLRAESPDILRELAVLSTLLLTPSLTALSLVDVTRSYFSFPALKQFFYAYALPRSLERVSVEGGWYDPRMIEPIAQGCRRVREIVIKKRGGDQIIKLAQQQQQPPERSAPPSTAFPNVPPISHRARAVSTSEANAAHGASQTKRPRTGTLPRKRNLVSEIMPTAGSMEPATTVPSQEAISRHFQIQRLDVRYWKAR